MDHCKRTNYEAIDFCLSFILLFRYSYSISRDVSTKIWKKLYKFLGQSLICTHLLDFHPIFIKFSSWIKWSCIASSIGLKKEHSNPIAQSHSFSKVSSCINYRIDLEKGIWKDRNKEVPFSISIISIFLSSQPQDTSKNIRKTWKKFVNLFYNATSALTYATDPLCVHKVVRLVKLHIIYLQYCTVNL